MNITQIKKKKDKRTYKYDFRIDSSITITNK